MKLSKIKAGRLLTFPIFLIIFTLISIYDYCDWTRKAKQDPYYLTSQIAYAYRGGVWGKFRRYCVKWLYGLNPEDENI